LIFGIGVVAVVVIVMQLPCTQVCPEEHPRFCGMMDELRGNVATLLGTHLYRIQFLSTQIELASCATPALS
jgi:hypothetical protein